MKLYLLTRINGDEIDWDEYLGAVIAAKSAKRAKEIMNGLESLDWKCTLISLCAKASMKEGIVLDSFNA